jgi:exodeoxyribonuclease VII large subunit
MSEAAARDIYTVARLNREIKALLEGRFPLLWVEGEISNLSRPASGHLYFTLKDTQAQVRCALFRGNQRAAVALRDGLQVVVRARVSLYEGRGDFQLIVESVEEAGEGALRRAFEELKRRLQQEGLFDQSIKKPLPRLPRRIGVITSPSGAVFHDILTTLKRRFPAIPVLLHPVPVQGEGAAEKIAAMLRLAGERGECDALILARGGGSLEDLQAFNSEIVARAIHACLLPVVAGVGHETDVTIADFVADARAPTPTAAAELLSPDRNEWLLRLASQERRLLQQLRDLLDERQQHLDYLRARLIHPQQRLEHLREKLAAHARHLVMLQQHARGRAAQRLFNLRARLFEQNPRTRLHGLMLRQQHTAMTLRQAARHALQQQQQRLARVGEMLNALSPLATLARGYAIVTTPAGNVVRRASTVKPGETVRTRLAQGSLLCRIEKIHEEGH